MQVSDLKFPVMCFNQETISVQPTLESLTVCTRVALQRGWFVGMLIVDSDGSAVRVGGAKKIRGVGPFWGYNVFLNQKIGVELAFEDAAFHPSLDQVKHWVLSSFKRRPGWSSRGDFDGLREKIKSSTTVADIISLLA